MFTIHSDIVLLSEIVRDERQKLIENSMLAIHASGFILDIHDFRYAGAVLVSNFPNHSFSLISSRQKK